MMTTLKILTGRLPLQQREHGKAVDRYQKVTNPSVEVQRKMALAFIEIDSVDRALVMFETIVNAGEDIEPEDYLNLSQLQDITVSTLKQIKIEKNMLGRRLERLGITFETSDNYYQSSLTQ